MNFCVNSGSSTHSRAEGPLQLAAEAGHALRNIGLETDPALLAVVGDVDAGLALLLHHVGDTLVDHVG